MLVMSLTVLVLSAEEHPNCAHYLIVLAVVWVDFA